MQLDVAKDDVFCLNRLDAPLLRLVLGGLSGHHSVMLWLTGDRKLRYLMSEGGAVARFRVSSKWSSKLRNIGIPGVILAFSGLNELSISTLRSSNVPLESFNCPESVKTLKLSFMRLDGFFSFLRLNPSRLSGLTTLKICDHNCFLGKDEISLLPKALEDLKVEIEEIAFLSFLPQSLTALNGRIVDTSKYVPFQLPNLRKLVLDIGPALDEEFLPTSFFEGLPRTLEWIDLCGRVVDVSCFLLLPPALTVLSFSACSGFSDLTCLATIVPHLTYLSMELATSLHPSAFGHLSNKLTYIDLGPIKNEPGFVPSWPPHATFIGHSILWQQFRDSDSFLAGLQALPPTLTQLNLGNADPVLLSTSAMEALPKSIINLSLPRLWAEITPLLPPKLETLIVISAPSSVSLSTLNLLPTSLTSIFFDDILVAPLSQGWARRLHSLRKLRIGFVFSVEFPTVTPSDLLGLPPSLTQLSLIGMVTPKSVQFPTIAEWKDGMKHLESLRTLLLRATSLDPNLLYGLGERVRDVELSRLDPNFPLTDAHLQAIPCLKRYRRISIAGASICTNQSKNYLSTITPKIVLPDSPFMEM